MPDIPDRSLCIFRNNGKSLQEGSLVLVQNQGQANEGLYTIKRYRGEEKYEKDGRAYTRVRLEPLGAAAPPPESLLEEEEFILAEFLCMLN